MENIVSEMKIPLHEINSRLVNSLLQQQKLPTKRGREGKRETEIKINIAILNDLNKNNKQQNIHNN